jgi:3-dehydroquinate dehydratase-1
MARITIKNMEFGAAVRVAGIIDRPTPQERLRRFIDRGVGIFEIRADLFNMPIGKVIGYIESIKESIHTPLIGTIRETDSNRADRAEQLVALSRYTDIIDIELGMPQWREVTIGADASCAIMVSEHDFNATPDLAGLDGIVKRALSQGAHIVKIAAMARCSADVVRLMRFAQDCGAPVVAMSMGDIGKISRIIAPLFGSLFVYGYLRKPLVPGQLSALAVIEALNVYYPGNACGSV